MSADLATELSALSDSDLSAIAQTDLDYSAVLRACKHALYFYNIDNCAQCYFWLGVAWGRRCCVRPEHNDAARAAVAFVERLATARTFKGTW